MIILTIGVGYVKTAVSIIDRMLRMPAHIHLVPFGIVIIRSIPVSVDIYRFGAFPYGRSYLISSSDRIQGLFLQIILPHLFAGRQGNEAYKDNI